MRLFIAIELEKNIKSALMEIQGTMKNVPFKPFSITLGGFGSLGDLWWTGLKKYIQSLDNLISFTQHYKGLFLQPPYT